eukprot:198898_1
MSSNQSDDQQSINSSYIKSVPEENAIIKTEDGLMTYIGNAIIKTEDGLMTYIGNDTQCSNYTNDNNCDINSNATLKNRSISSLSVKKRRKRKHREKQKRDKKNINNNNQSQSERMIRKPNKEPGTIAVWKSQTEWDCLTVSSDQEWVALFSKNSMALLKITEYGKFEQLRDLKAGRKESRLKYGAVDAQFYYGDNSKLISCTRNGTLIVLNLNFKGRGCVALNDCKLKQRVHKVTWIKNSFNVLSAAEDGNCYLWDTRTEGGCNGNGLFIGGKSFNKSTAALSVKMSPFNDNLFASSHKNGTINIWDIRNEKCPFLTITAHSSSVGCIDWHPAIPNVMASCGFRDITIKIWNLSDDKIAQNKYYQFWNQLNKHRYYNYE